MLLQQRVDLLRAPQMVVDLSIRRLAYRREFDCGNESSQLRIESKKERTRLKTGYTRVQEDKHNLSR